MVILKRTKDNQWQFLIKAANGKVLVTSETYKRKHNAMIGFVALQKAVLDIIKTGK